MAGGMLSQGALMKGGLLMAGPLASGLRESSVPASAEVFAQVVHDGLLARLPGTDPGREGGAAPLYRAYYPRRGGRRGYGAA